jgi:hypothetical protein
MSKPTSKNAQMSEDERALFSESIAQQANVEVEQEVPDWHRAQAFEQHFEIENNKAKAGPINWGMWLGVPSLSMACSAFAITIVMTFMQDKGFDQQAFDKQVTAMIDQQVQQKVAAQLTTTLANKDNSDIERLVNLKLREFAVEQQVILANYRTDISEQQQNNNLALAGYVIGASRKERKEDMSDFISFFNAQRQDEQLAQKIKFQQLEREISFKNIALERNNKVDNSSNKPVNTKG